MNLEKFLYSKKVTRVFLSLLLIVVMITFVQMFSKAYRTNGYDFTSYLLSAKALLEHQDPYITGSPFTYIYPLFLAFVLIPMACIPYSIANILWFIIGIFSLYYITKTWIELAKDEVGTEWGGHLFTPLVTVFFLIFNVIQNNLLNGQVNIVVLALIIAFYKMMKQNKNFYAALFLSMGIAIKIVPAIFFLMLLVKRKFKVLFGSVVLTIGFIWLPGILAGKSIISYYHYYIDQFLLSKLHPMSVGKVDQTYYTLSGFLDHIFPSAGLSAYFSVIGLLVIVFVLLFVEFFRKRKSDDSYIFSLYLIAILFLNPMSETHHLILMLPGFLIVFLKMIFGNFLYNKLSLFLFVLFFVLFYSAKAFSPNPFYFLALLSLFVNLVYMCKRSLGVESKTRL